MLNRAAIPLAGTVVSARSRRAIATFASSPLARSLKSIIFQPRQRNSSSTKVSAWLSALSRRSAP